VHAYLTGTLRGLECDPLQVGGVQDHVHILCGLSRKISLAELIKNLKTSSTRIVKGKGHDAFSWQSGYGAFSFSQSARESVFSYIAKQEILNAAGIRHTFELIPGGIHSFDVWRPALYNFVQKIFQPWAIGRLAAMTYGF